MNDRVRVLDTDILSIWQRHPEQIEHYLIAFPPEQRAITIITAEEQLRGRLAVVRKARDSAALVRAYTYLCETLAFLSKINVLPFNDAAATKFVNLCAQRIHIGTQDLRIAATVLSFGGILITRNHQDFSKVPGLTIEDWTK